MYNERFMKRAPQYGANARARTYQDYMRNIQNQRMAAGQTFGNLAMQQQDQSFYDRAMGRPPGLSGGMAQQFQNQMGAARSRQLGQIAQQRYQAFSDIAAQEAQASQFARAEAAAEQQFQAQELQFQAQRQAQAKQIMATGQAQEVKEAQLRDLGFTYGEIERLQPNRGTTAVGGAASAGLATFGGFKAYNYSQEAAAREVLKGDVKITELRDALKAAQDKPVTAGDATQGIEAYSQETKNIDVKKASDALKEGKEKAMKEILDVRKNTPTLDKNLQKEIDKLDDLVAKGVQTGDDAVIKTDAILKQKKLELARMKQIKAAGLKKFKAKAALTKAMGAKKAFGVAAAKVAAGLGVALAIFIAVEGISTLVTGVGLVEGIGNVISTGDYRRGKKGLFD